MTPRLQLLAASLLIPFALLGTALAAPPAADAKKPQDDPPKDPKARLAAILEKHHKKYGEDMLYDVDEKLKIIFVIGTDKRMLDETKQRLTAHAEALQRDLFKHGLDNYLSVIVPKKWANQKVTGHFYPNWVDAATIGSSLMHEFTHALHYADQAGRDEYQPVWLMEGFATMYESSKVVDGHAVPIVNRRLIELQKEVSNKQYLPLEKMMKLERRQFTSHQYAQARYMCMWLQATGQLPKWYATYTAGFKEDPTGVAATEKIYGKKIAELDKDWVAWLLKLEQPKVVLGPGSAGLGIGTKQAPDGIEITQLAPQGAAENAKLAVGDILINIGGERVIEMETLVTVLGSHKVGDTVKIEYRRAGKYAETTTQLTPVAAPAEPKPAEPKPAG